MRERGWNDVGQLHADFVERCRAILARHGLAFAGWEETALKHGAATAEGCAPAQHENTQAVEGAPLPLPKPGFYIVELASPRLGSALHGEDKPYYVSTSVLVTNLAVHLKHGRESSLVWVTSLDRGQPVAGAHVSVRDCAGKIWFEGDTDAKGLANAKDALPLVPDVASCKGRRELYAFARTAEDISFTSSAWSDGIQPWNFNLRAETYRRKPLTIHTVFDRTLFRAGETVSMKHLARTPTGDGFRLPSADELPANAELEHVGSGQKFKLDVRFDAQGIAVSFIQSIYHEFGSGVVLAESGVNWQNRGASFSLDPAHINTLEPGKKPFHTLNPALARLDDGRVVV